MSTPSANVPLPAVVLGGGLAGLAAARLLRRHFPRVVVLERDRRAETADPEDAFADWERPGVPQFRHSHAFLARLRVVLLAHLPDVLDRLRGAGVREFGIDEVTPPGVALAPRADDEDVVLLACRRSTFEWALRASVAGRPGIELGEGVMVESLVGEARDGGRPTVTGVRLADGSTIPAAIVVDATGRRSRAPGWLAALGAPAPYERSAETGIFYYTRFYRLRRGRGPRGTTRRSSATPATWRRRRATSTAAARPSCARSGRPPSPATAAGSASASRSHSRTRAAGSPASPSRPSAGSSTAPSCPRCASTRSCSGGCCASSTCSTRPSSCCATRSWCCARCPSWPACCAATSRRTSSRASSATRCSRGWEARGLSAGGAPRVRLTPPTAPRSRPPGSAGSRRTPSASARCVRGTGTRPAASAAAPSGPSTRRSRGRGSSSCVPGTFRAPAPPRAA